MDKVRQILTKNKNIILITLVIVLILLHGTLDRYFRIDNVTIFLLLILLLIPYFSNIRKIKYGEFEAEIKPEEVQAVGRKVEEVSPKKNSEKDNDVQEIKDLAENDIRLALAKVRLEMERQLRILFDIYMPDRESSDNMNLKKIMKELKTQEIVDPSLFDPMKEIMDLTNRAVHGDTISKKTALRLIDIAGTVLSELEFTILNHALRSAKVEAIKEDKVEEFINSKYKLTAVNTLADPAERRTYTMNQKELDAYLENYEEYDEFIVKLRQIK